MPNREDLEKAGSGLSRQAPEQKRKFNIAKVAGSARNLQPIKDSDRLFKERKLIWDDVQIDAKSNDEPSR